ncbi:hypothetical protein BsWGS_19886 [Bradybaena similaris]
MASRAVTEPCGSLQEAEKFYVYFWKKDSCFSQWYPSMFRVDGQSYYCAEQYMMHQKALICQDHEAAAKMLRCRDPAEMKKLGRSVKNWDLHGQTWEDRCFDVVKRGNLHKFSQNLALKAQLLATDGKQLVEASPVDTKWGIGLAKENSLAWNQSTWKGKNLLGKALTEVREELKNTSGH